MSLCMRL